VPGRQCDECGASLGAADSCQEHFHALLLLESEVPGGPGNVAHFYAIASYGVQHPGSMGYTAATLSGLHAALCDMVRGTADLSDIRRRARYAAVKAGRVTRRPGDGTPEWGTIRWPVTVVDVLEKGVEGYRESVASWARSIVEAVGARQPALRE
jgi:hypothetical protein